MIENGLVRGGGGGGTQGAQFGGFVLRSRAERRLPQADWESGPSRSDLRAALCDLGFTFLTGANQIHPCCVLRVCVFVCPSIGVTPRCFQLDAFLIGSGFLSRAFQLWARINTGSVSHLNKCTLLLLSPGINTLGQTVRRSGAILRGRGVATGVSSCC